MWKPAFIACLALLGCGPGGYDRGTRFDDPPITFGHGMPLGGYDGAPVPGGEGVGEPAGAPDRVISSEELAAAGLPVGDGAFQPVEPVTSAPLDGTGISGTAPSADNAGISDEQSFEAVSSRETIESDAQRLARQAEAYRVIPPAPVPTRTETHRPNIVSFALSTQNAVGEQIYDRSGINLAGRQNRACGRYPSADQAQEAFLARGGPDADRLGVDPDGDGFACSWDPTPFRAGDG